MTYMTKQTRRPVNEGGAIQTTIRMDVDLLARAGALIEFMTQLTGFPASRADVWREALVRGLASMERERDR